MSMPIKFYFLYVFTAEETKGKNKNIEIKFSKQTNQKNQIQQIC